MKKTPSGTSVGVADPYEHAGVCDHVTDDGRCRYAVEHPEHDPAFAAERRAEGFRCPVVADAQGEGAVDADDPDRDPGPDLDLDWSSCPHYRFRMRNRECVRCGLEERRDALGDERPLLEEHHLAYPDGDAGHEITVFLCRWCHAKIHDSWASIADDASPDPEAIAAAEGRRSRERSELDFETAADRYDED